MPKVASTLTWFDSRQTYELVGPPSGEALSLVPDSPAWLAWLAERSSFAFRGKEGSFTARLEAVQRGERSWYAYRHTCGPVRKKYLGKTAELTLARLEQVARILQAERSGGEVSDPARPSHPEPHEPQASLPADPFTPLLSTRLHVPRPPVRLVPRTRLLERLGQGLEQTLILLCAPAGFGKTTLLAEFLAECRLPVAWLSLDVQDNDPLRFLWAVLAALGTCDPALGASVRPFFSSPRGLSLPAVYGLLLNEIADRDTDLLLVLDDSHLISEPGILQALASLVEHCPPNLHLVLSTRADPPLPLARLRAHGQLCELRAADLQFDAEEARHFLQTALGRELSASTLATILTRTEGWAAGLQLLALSLQARRSEAEVRAWLADEAGRQRHLIEYLTAEVLAQQPEAVQAFLLHTCLLDPLSASLCAAVRTCLREYRLFPATRRPLLFEGVSMFLSLAPSILCLQHISNSLSML